MKLGYWDIRGRAEAIRYALEYAGAEYEEKLYVMDIESPPRCEEWQKDKVELSTMGFTFPNLPYLIDGDVKMTESMAILKYVSRKHALMPKCDEEYARAYNLEGVLIGVTNTFYQQFFVPIEKYQEALKKFREETYPDFLTKVIKLMGDHKWLVSDEITYLDFQFYSLLKKVTELNKKSLEPFPKMKQYVQNFEAIPKMEKYINSKRFRKYPITAPVARWGFREEKS